MTIIYVMYVLYVQEISYLFYTVSYFIKVTNCKLLHKMGNFFLHT